MAPNPYKTTSMEHADGSRSCKTCKHAPYGFPDTPCGLCIAMGGKVSMWRLKLPPPPGRRCSTCRHLDVPMDEEPCNVCRHSHYLGWRPKDGTER